MINPVRLVNCAFIIGASLLLQARPKPATLYDIEVKDIEGKAVQLSKYKGKVLLIVNVASKCGLAPQYNDLQAIYEEYQDKGLVVLGFPSNDFMNQEPKKNADIKTFCEVRFGVTFPMFSKISVRGRAQHPLYQHLTQKKQNGQFNAPVRWNFQKYLVGRDGKILRVIPPTQRVKHQNVRQAIQRALNR